VLLKIFFDLITRLMFFVQIEIAIGIEIVLAVEMSFEVPLLFDPDFDCPASSLTSWPHPT
jgi:hypothetical protein